jgi:hypothetical protein
MLVVACRILDWIVLRWYLSFFLFSLRLLLYLWLFVWLSRGGTTSTAVVVAGTISEEMSGTHIHIIVVERVPVVVQCML